MEPFFEQVENDRWRRWLSDEPSSWQFFFRGRESPAYSGSETHVGAGMRGQGWKPRSATVDLLRQKTLTDQSAGPREAKQMGDFCRAAKAAEEPRGPTVFALATSTIELRETDRLKTMHLWDFAQLHVS